MPRPFPDAYFSTQFLLEDPPDPLPGRFAIVTACNPMDEGKSEEENLRADRELKRRLEALKTTHFRATGGSPDLSHAEPGWAIETDHESAMKVAREFKQRAIWWIDGGELHLVACDGSASEFIGPFSERLLDP